MGNASGPGHFRPSGTFRIDYVTRDGSIKGYYEVRFEPDGRSAAGNVRELNGPLRAGNSNWVRQTSAGSGSSGQSKTDYCRDYTNLAIARQNENVQRACRSGGDRWHTDYSKHYNWCTGVALEMSASETHGRDTDMQSCHQSQPTVPQGKPRVFYENGNISGVYNLRLPDPHGIHLAWCKPGCDFVGGLASPNSRLPPLLPVPVLFLKKANCAYTHQEV